MPFKGEPSIAPAWLPDGIASSWNLGSAAIARTLKHAKTPRRIDPARRMGLACESIKVHTDDGVCLDAWYLPGSAEVMRRSSICAVLHHHYGGQKATVLPWVEFFHRIGIATLAFDGRGHGASDPAPTGRGSFIHRAADVIAACDEARRRGADSILAFGQSQGAAALVMGICGRDDLLGCILDSGPAPDMGSAAWGLAGNMLGRDAKDRPMTRALLSARIIPGTQPFRYLTSLWWSLRCLRTVPMLWVHGSLDQVIPRSRSQLWFNALRPKGDLWQGVEVQGAQHVRCLAVGGKDLQAQVSEFVNRLDVVAAPRP